ncbi:MAG: hypothetical protein HQL69_23015 [Magnetococcales bacterium]|nr:hypothetical protein [Magnetococcales bacterium]
MPAIKISQMSATRSLVRGLVLTLATLLLVSCSPAFVLPPKLVATEPVATEPSGPPIIDSSPPQWRLGDTWSYSDGYGLKVTDIDDEGVATLTRTDIPDYWIKRRGIFKVESLSGKAHRKVIFRSTPPDVLFPLESGKVVEFVREFTRNLQLRKHKTLWRVAGKETIEVPAGRFECWVLDWHTKSLISEWEGKERWWYVPKIKNFIRLEYRYGNTPAGSRVLMDYQVD